METSKKKRINALDVLIVLLLIAMITAFFFREQIYSAFREDENQVVTYSFLLTDVEKEHAAYLKKDCLLYNSAGVSVGQVLTVSATDAEDEKLLDSGKTVQVKNGSLDLTGTVTASGYATESFVYLADGTLLVPGGTLVVSTGDAIYTLTITSVEATVENRAN